MVRFWLIRDLGPASITSRVISAKYLPSWKQRSSNCYAKIDASQLFVKNHIKIPHVWSLKMWNMMFQTMDKHDDFGAPPRSKIALIFGHLAKSSSLPSETSSAAMAFWGFFGPQKSLKKWSDVSYCEVFLLYLMIWWCPKICSTFAESLNFMRGTSDHIG